MSMSIKLFKHIKRKMKGMKFKALRIMSEGNLHEQKSKYITHISTNWIHLGIKTDSVI